MITVKKVMIGLVFISQSSFFACTSYLDAQTKLSLEPEVVVQNPPAEISQEEMKKYSAKEIDELKAAKEVVEEYWISSYEEMYDLFSTNEKQRLRSHDGISNATDFRNSMGVTELVWTKETYQKVEMNGDQFVKITVLVEWFEEGYEGVTFFVFDMVKELDGWKIEHITATEKLDADLLQEWELQDSVDQGHQPWRLEPIYVASAAMSAKDSAINYDDCEIVSETSDKAIVDCHDTCTYRILLERLVRPNGIWTAVEVQTIDQFIDDERADRSDEISESKLKHNPGSEQCLLIDREYEPEARISCMVDVAISKNQSAHEREKAFELLMDWWEKRDGAGCFYLSDAFLDILQADYKFFFAQMKKYPTEYNDWISELDVLSFVGLEFFPLEEKRLQLIERLEAIRDLDERTDLLRVEMIDTLREIIPRQID